MRTVLSRRSVLLGAAALPIAAKAGAIEAFASPAVPASYVALGQGFAILRDFCEPVIVLTKAGLVRPMPVDMAAIIHFRRPLAMAAEGETISLGDEIRITATAL